MRQERDWRAAERAALSEALARFQPRAVTDAEASRGELRRASVALVVAGEAAGEAGEAALGLLMTRRAASLRRHAGQYALPGGRLDPGETATEAALRELDEELGLALGSDRVLGRLDDFPTRSGFAITPIVVWAGPAPTITPDPSEVAMVFHIPFNELDSAAIPQFEPGLTPERPVLCADLPAIGERMYSPTAAILYQFREVALRGRDTRVAHYDQPAFAWR